MWDEKSVYPKIESGFLFTPYMNNVCVEAFYIQTFDQEYDESAILKVKFYNPHNLIFQHLSFDEKVGKREVNRMRHGYIAGTFASIDIHEILEVMQKVNQIYEGAIYRKNFKRSPFRKVIENLFALRQIYKDDVTDLIQAFVKLVMIIFLESKLERTLVNFVKVNHNIGWKQNMMIMI